MDWDIEPSSLRTAGSNDPNELPVEGRRADTEREEKNSTSQVLQSDDPLNRYFRKCCSPTDVIVATFGTTVAVLYARACGRVCVRACVHACVCVCT